MSAVPVTIVGMLADENGSRSVTLVGLASLTGLGVGGGPIIPDKPPGVPTHPIVLPGDPSWGDPHPEHPIVIPKPPTEPPLEPPVDGGEITKPPPPDGGWGYSPDYGWGYFPGKGAAGPK